MKIAIIYNKDFSGVINRFGIQNKEIYSPNTVKKVAAALESGGHNVIVLDGNMHVIERLQNFMPKVMEGERIGMIFNMAYGIQGESRYTHIPSMLEMLGIPYVGSSPSGHGLALDKVISKIIFQKQGISTPDFWVFSNPDEDLSAVTYPAIVKPKMESVSYGLKVVHDKKQLQEAIGYIIKEFQQQALVETFIQGREFCIGLLGNSPVETFPILEIDLEGDSNAIQTLENKKQSPRRKICPASISRDLAERMRKLSVRAFQSLQLRDFARVDVRVDGNNDIHVLEINSMASLGETGSYLTAAGVAGYDFAGLVNKILDVAVVRYFSESSLSIQPADTKTKMPLSVKLRGYLRSRQEYFENLLGKMVNINSHVRNVTGVNDLGNVIRKEFGQLGFTQEVFSQLEVGNQLFFTNSFDDHYDILLMGNLDNDRRISNHEYFRQGEQKLYGTGIWEHKGGLAVAISALQALKFTRLLKRLKIGFLITTDDSLQGKFAKSLIVDKSGKSALVLGLHGADLNGSIVTSRSGSAVFHFSQKLIRQDESEHIPLASSIFSKLIGSWCDLSINDKDLVISPAYTRFNSVIREPYAFGEASISVRFNRIEDFENAEIKMKKLIPKRKYKNFLHFQIEGGLRRPPLVETDTIKSLWKRIKKTADGLDISVTREHRWSSSDICFVEKDKPAADGMGPVGTKPKEGSESILRHSLIDRALLLAMVISEAGSPK